MWCLILFHHNHRPLLDGPSVRLKQSPSLNIYSTYTGPLFVGSRNCERIQPFKKKIGRASLSCPTHILIHLIRYGHQLFFVIVSLSYLLFPYFPSLSHFLTLIFNFFPHSETPNFFFFNIQFHPRTKLSFFFLVLVFLYATQPTRRSFLVLNRHDIRRRHNRHKHHYPSDRAFPPITILPLNNLISS